MFGARFVKRRSRTHAMFPEKLGIWKPAIRPMQDTHNLGSAKSVKFDIDPLHQICGENQIF
jgi:hypothetical protein